jgi:hypothetical protein
MNQKQLAYLKSILTPEQLTTFLEMKKTRPKKVVITTEKIALPICQATKKDKNRCSNKSKINEHYCGVHLKTFVKVSDVSTDAVLLSATA